MFILDLPYVSEFLIKTVIQHGIPVLDTPQKSKLGLNGNINFISEKRAREDFLQGKLQGIYSNSENAIEWVAHHLPHTALANQIDLFKDKVRFRELLRSKYPDYFFKAIPVGDISTLDVSAFPKPFIIKPAVGFFSLGVFKVSSDQDWDKIKLQILQEVEEIRHVYPARVLNTTTFIIEENIEGDEYAFDAYFDTDGKAVLLGLFKHLYASDHDVSDRVYISSKLIFEDKRKAFENFLTEIGQLAGLKNFPLHVEVRVDESGTIRPIEINPMRFGGWCTTADMTWFAYGLNPYTAFHYKEKPDWERLLENKDGLIYSNIVLTNSTGFNVKQIRSFDYDRLLTHFEKPLELRKADFKNYLIFGFLFAETRSENFAELEWILNTDLKEFIEV